MDVTDVLSKHLLVPQPSRLLWGVLKLFVIVKLCVQVLPPPLHILRFPRISVTSARGQFKERTHSEGARERVMGWRNQELHDLYK